VIPKEEVLGMRKEVIRLIPRVIYANPNSRLESCEDAFDVTIKKVLNRIEAIWNSMNGENNSATGNFPEEYAWKYNLSGGLENQEWNGYFTRQ